MFQAIIGLRFQVIIGLRFQVIIGLRFQITIGLMNVYMYKFIKEIPVEHSRSGKYYQALYGTT